MINTKEWLQSRRDFVKKISFLAGASSLPWFINSCTTETAGGKRTINFDYSQYYILLKVHQVLFPNDKYGPGASDFNTVEYLDWVLSDNNFDKNDKEYMLNGIKWMEESSDEKFGKSFSILSDLEIEELVKVVVKQSWGESWLSRNLTFIFEAQFSDELYGSNIGGKGWKWLSHYPGYPRPTADMIYDEVFETISNINYR